MPLFCIDRSTFLALQDGAVTITWCVAPYSHSAPSVSARPRSLGGEVAPAHQQHCAQRAPATVTARPCPAEPASWASPISVRSPKKLVEDQEPRAAAILRLQGGLALLIVD